MMQVFTALNAHFDGWLRAPEPNAAGRMSLYRILYGLFFLSTLPSLGHYYDLFGPLPADLWQPLDSMAWLQPPPPAPWLLQWLPVVMTFALVLVVLGLWTRPATLVVLIAAVFLAGTLYSYKNKIDHGDTYLIAYIPVIMLFARWDSNYSINALLRRQRHGVVVDPATETWTYIWPMRAIILLLSLMFFGAGLTKIIGSWVRDLNTFRDILLEVNVLAVLDQRPPSALNLALAQMPLVMIVMQFSGILIQLLFPLNLLNQRFRAFFFAVIVLFHTLNYLLLGINTYMMLIAYLVIVDWQALLGRFLPEGERLSRLPALVLMGGSLLIAALVTMVATQVSFVDLLLLREVGLWVATPVALVIVVISAIAIVREDILPRLRREKRQTVAPTV